MAKREKVSEPKVLSGYKTESSQLCAQYKTQLRLDSAGSIIVGAHDCAASPPLDFMSCLLGNGYGGVLVPALCWLPFAIDLALAPIDYLADKASDAYSSCLNTTTNLYFNLLSESLESHEDNSDTDLIGLELLVISFGDL